MIRVLVVDDSAVIRRLVTSALSEDPDIDVIGTAANGRIALAKIAQLRPDAVTLDIEMPELDGLGTLAELRRTDPRLPVVMFSTLTEKGALTTLEALSLGASDYVTKPANVGSIAESFASVREQLVPKLKALCASGGRSALLTRRADTRAVPVAVPPGAPVTGERRTTPLEAVVLGCSTGGPDALASVLAALPGDLPVPILVVQHMPPLFTTIFAQRLDNGSALRVAEATPGAVAAPGTVLIAPGDHHMTLRRSAAGVTVRLDQGPQENFCRPAVDPLFRSAAEVYGGDVLAVVLTGMGQDGAAGCKVLKDRGASVLVQDEQTSVVWGMPGAVAAAGLADQVLPLDQVAGAVTAAVRAHR